MKQLKFISKDAFQKKFGEAVRSKVNNYFKKNGISKKGNGSMYAKACIMLAIYIVPFVVVIAVSMNTWIAFLLIILMGIGEAGVGMAIMHDAAHGAFSTKKWVNNLFASTMYLLGSNTFNWKIQHNVLHHTFTNIDGFDRDIETKAVIRLSHYAPLKRFHRFQHIYAFLFYGLMTLSKLVTDFRQLLKYNRENFTQEHGRKPTLEIFKLIITKIGYFSIIIGLPFLITDYAWWQILIGFIILHITAGIIMSTVFQMAHIVDGAEQDRPGKEGLIKNSWAVHELLTTSDFARNNTLLNWYVGGLNFQIEHHLFPNICHIHYRKIAPTVERTAHEFGLPYNLKPSFIDALASHARSLKALGRQKAIKQQFST